MFFLKQDSSWDKWMIEFRCTHLVNNLPQYLHFILIGFSRSDEVI